MEIKTRNINIIIKNLENIISQEGACNNIKCEECIFSSHFDKNNKRCKHNDILSLSVVDLISCERIKQLKLRKAKQIIQKLKRKYNCENINWKEEIIFHNEMVVLLNDMFNEVKLKDRKKTLKGIISKMENKYNLYIEED